MTKTMSAERMDNDTQTDIAKDVYRAAAVQRAPYWLNVLGATPWFEESWQADHACDEWSSYQKASAALSLGLFCEVFPQAEEAPYLGECVRAGLVQWQSLLGRDGRPRHRLGRRDPLTAAIATQVVRLLTETTHFQTSSLIEDLSKHMRWLSRRVERASWVEALAVSALSDAATLIGEPGLLSLARERLNSLLARQDEEGWFPEDGGPELSRWSVTTDALARVWHEQGWPQLEAPLRKAIGFARRIVGPQPREIAAGPLGIVGPYGLELLAGRVGEAAVLARQCREFHRLLQADVGAAGESSEAGVSLMFAVMVAPTTVAHTPETTAHANESLPRAGFWIEETAAYRAVVEGRRGGALHIVWRDGTVLDDPGVAVVHSHGIKSSGHATRVEAVRFLDRGLISRGVLRRMAGHRAQGAGWLRRRRAALPDIEPVTVEGGGEHGFHPHLHDHFEREVNFEDDAIRIRDRVDCLLPCVAVVCQSPLPGSSMRYGIPPAAPIFIEGGRHVELTRLFREGALVEQRVRRTPRTGK